MPRASKVKSSKHGSAVPFPKRDAAIEPQAENVPEQSSNVEIGPSDVSYTKLKKGKEPAFKADLISPHPYSRSHVRREKRKSKQNLAGGDLGHLSTAIAEVESPPLPPPSQPGIKAAPKRIEKTEKEDKGKIGQGKGRTMSEHARRKQIALEAKRIPAIMQHPAYKASPWSTIRLHASNSLATVPPIGQKKKAVESMEVE